MSGRLITTYIARVKVIQKEDYFKDAIKLYIARGMAPLSSLSSVGFKQILELAPSASLLNDYKSGKVGWGQYVSRFHNQMNTPETKRYLDLIEKRLNEGFDVVVVCFEKDFHHCHRFLISEYIASRGFECCEYLEKVA